MFGLEGWSVSPLKLKKKIFCIFPYIFLEKALYQLEVISAPQDSQDILGQKCKEENSDSVRGRIFHSNCPKTTLVSFLHCRFSIRD